MGKLTISMAIFNSYAKLPEGILCFSALRARLAKFEFEMSLWLVPGDLWGSWGWAWVRQGVNNSAQFFFFGGSMTTQEWISSDSAHHPSGAFPRHCGAGPARCSASGRGFYWNWATVTRKKSGVPCKTATMTMSATRTW